jgi:hypothetical protein
MGFVTPHCTCRRLESWTTGIISWYVAPEQNLIANQYSLAGINTDTNKMYVKASIHIKLWSCIHMHCRKIESVYKLTDFLIGVWREILFCYSYWVIIVAVNYKKYNMKPYSCVYCGLNLAWVHTAMT